MTPIAAGVGSEETLAAEVLSPELIPMLFADVANSILVRNLWQVNCIMYLCTMGYSRTAMPDNVHKSA